MNNIVKKIVNTKQFHIGMLILIIFVIIFIIGLITLRYNVEGETNLPFNLSQISVVSTVEGIDKQDQTNKWNLEVNENNDIYVYIKKNDNYKGTEAIECIKLDNFNIHQKPNIGTIKLYKPDNSVNSIIFRNTEENECRNIEYIGSMDSSIKEQKISNQGGLVVFRYAITDIGSYISNDDQEINHSELLKRLSINNEDLRFKISFDIYINLVSGNSYKSNINLELPINDIVNNGTQSIEYKDMEKIVFKRT